MGRSKYGVQYTEETGLVRFADMNGRQVPVYKKFHVTEDKPRKVIGNVKTMGDNKGDIHVDDN